MAARRVLASRPCKTAISASAKASSIAMISSGKKYIVSMNCGDQAKKANLDRILIKFAAQNWRKWEVALRKQADLLVTEGERRFERARDSVTAVDDTVGISENATRRLELISERPSPSPIQHG
jgi:hypothetical protein